MQHFTTLQIRVFHYNCLTLYIFFNHLFWRIPIGQDLKKSQYFPTLQIGVFHYNWLTFFLPSFLKHSNWSGPKKNFLYCFSTPFCNAGTCCDFVRPWLIIMFQKRYLKYYPFFERKKWNLAYYIFLWNWSLRVLFLSYWIIETTGLAQLDFDWSALVQCTLCYMLYIPVNKLSLRWDSGPLRLVLVPGAY